METHVQPRRAIASQIEVMRGDGREPWENPPPWIATSNRRSTRKPAPLDPARCPLLRAVFRRALARSALLGMKMPTCDPSSPKLTDRDPMDEVECRDVTLLGRTKRARFVSAPVASLRCQLRGWYPYRRGWPARPLVRGTTGTATHPYLGTISFTTTGVPGESVMDRIFDGIQPWSTPHAFTIADENRDVPASPPTSCRCRTRGPGCRPSPSRPRRLRRQRRQPGRATG